jgi:hypothetical protein
LVASRVAQRVRGGDWPARARELMSRIFRRAFNKACRWSFALAGGLWLKLVIGAIRVRIW